MVETTYQTKEDVREGLHYIVREKLGVEDDIVLTDKTHFVDDLDADSLDVVQTILDIEEKFEIDIPNEDAVKITTLGQAIDYVSKKLRL